MMHFASPWWFALIPLLLAILFLAPRARRRRDTTFRYGSTQLLNVRRSFRAATEMFPLILTVAGACVLVGALARPQSFTRSARNERLGIDIVIVLDSSGSMAAEDFRPRNRFTVAKELLAEFIQRRTSDRIGIVTFGARAATRVPVTYDLTAASSILDGAKIGEHGDGTAIGQGIATAVNRLRGSKAESRIIILVTDGVNNAGSIEPATAAVLAKRYGVKLYSIGVGSRGEVPVPVRVQNRLTGQIETIYQYIRADLDEPLLTAISKETGGRYFRAVDEGALQSVLDEIDRLEKSRIEAERNVVVRELYLLPLIAGCILVLIGLIAGETIWLRLPA